MDQPKPRILVIDDEPRNVKLLEAHLITQGYDVVTAEDGETGLRMLANKPVDLVFVDVMMPGIDGFEVTRRLRADPKTRLLPIVIVTALKDTDYRIQGIEAGCDDFIGKPYDKNEILARTKTLLRMSYFRGQLDEKEKFASAMDQITDGLVVLDDGRRVVLCNRRAAEWLGLDPAASAGTDFPAHLASRFKVSNPDDILPGLASGPLAFDVERPESDSVKRLVLAFRSRPVKDPSGELSSIVLSLHDATDERRQAALKQDFLDLVSHKLRTPVTTISFSASELQGGSYGPMTPDQKDVIDDIVAQSHRLTDLIEKLLECTTIGGAAVNAPPERIALKTYLPRIADTLAKRPDGKPVELTLDGLDADPVIYANRVHVNLVLGNLVDNAVKFSTRPPAKVRIRVEGANGRVRCAVTDQGPGIPPEEHEKIFEPFYQVESAFTGNVAGAGLGLTVVKRIAAAYGSGVEVQSTLGKGSTFAVSFPSAPPA